MSPTVTIAPDGEIHVPIADWYVTPQMDVATRAIPGRHYAQQGRAWAWGYSREVLMRLTALGLTLAPEATALLAAPTVVRAPNQRTPVRHPFPDTLAWRAATPGREHQREFKWWRRGGGLDGRMHPTAFLEAGKGTGKTLSAIEEILELLARRDARVLILARNSNLVTVWLEQITRHAPDLLPLTVILNGPRRRRLEMLHEMRSAPRVFVHNHEDLPAMGRALADETWELVIVDETSRFRTASAGRVRHLTGASAKKIDAPFKLALSGSPMIKRYTDLYPAMKWLGAPVGSKQAFIDRFLMVDLETGEQFLKDASLHALLDTYRFCIPKGTVLNLPRAWHYERVTLNAWQQDAYRRVRRELRTIFVDAAGTVIGQREITIRLTEMMRLAQVAAGFEAIDTEHFNWRDDNPKTRYLLEEVLPEFRGEKVILWAHYQAEIQNLARLTAAAGWKPVTYYGGNAEADNDAHYQAFKFGDADLFIANTGKGAHGLNLPDASTMVYYTRTFDTESWSQSLDRNVRLDTDPDANLNIVVIEAADTVDQLITRVLGDDLHRAASITSLDVAYELGL